MKCPKCQSEMIKAKESMLCMECGHLEVVAPGSVPVLAEDKTVVATAAPAATDPVAAEAPDPITTPTPDPEPAVIMAPEPAPAPPVPVKHTIDHAAQAAASPAALVEPKTEPEKPATTEEPVVESEPGPEPKPAATPTVVSKPAADNSPRAIDGPSRLAPVSAASLHPAPVVKSEPNPVAKPLSGPALETIKAPEPPSQRIAQDAPVSKPALPKIAPVTHPRPVNKRLVTNIIVLFFALCVSAGIIYAYFQGIDLSLLLPKR